MPKLYGYLLLAINSHDAFGRDQQAMESSASPHFNFRTVDRSIALAIVRRREMSHGHRRYATLLFLIKAFQDSQCSDPRDHVYALMSLATTQDAEFLLLMPDHSRSPLVLFMHLSVGILKQKNTPPQRFQSLKTLANVLGIDQRAAMCDRVLARLWQNDLHCGLLWDTGTIRSPNQPQCPA